MIRDDLGILPEGQKPKKKKATPQVQDDLGILSPATEEKKPSTAEEKPLDWVNLGEKKERPKSVRATAKGPEFKVTQEGLKQEKEGLGPLGIESGKAIWEGAKGLVRGLMGVGEMGLESWEKEEEKVQKALAKELEEEGQKDLAAEVRKGRVPAEATQKALEQFQQAIPSEKLETGEQYSPRWWLLQGIREAPQLAAMLGLTASGHPSAGMALIGGEIAGQTYKDLRSEDVDPETAKRAAIANAGIQALLERAGVGGILRKVEGAGARRLVSVLQSIKIEGITEAIQEVPDYFTQLAAKSEDAADFYQKVLDTDWGKLAKRMGVAGIFGAGLGAAADVSLQAGAAVKPKPEPEFTFEEEEDLPDFTFQQEITEEVPADIDLNEDTVIRAFENISEGEPSQRVQRVREESGLDQETFNQTLKKLHSRGIINLHNVEIPKQETKGQEPTAEGPKQTILDALQEVGQGRPFQRIHHVREASGLDRETFDQALKELQQERRIDLHGGDPSKLTEQEIEDSYQDEFLKEQGLDSLYITMSPTQGKPAVTKQPAPTAEPKVESIMSPGPNYEVTKPRTTTRFVDVEELPDPQVSGVQVDGQGDVTMDEMQFAQDVVATKPEQKRLLLRMRNKWDKKVADPVVNKIKSLARKHIGSRMSEGMKYQLGVERSPEAQDLLRDYQRTQSAIWDDALEIGRQIQEIAPTSAEQKRMMQILQGGLTSDPRMRQKAFELQDRFQRLQEAMKQANLLQYSRYDKLTRKQRANIRNTIRRAEQFNLYDTNQLTQASNILGVPMSQQAQKDLQSLDPERRARAEEKLQGQVLDSLKFQRQRLRDYYHWGSHKEYVPFMYTKKEGLSKQQRKILQDELKRLQKLKESATGDEAGMLGQEIAALKQQLGKKPPGQFNKHELALDRGPTIRRKDMPEEVRNILGKIEEAPYPIAKGLAKEQTDLAKLEVLKYIADKPEWAYKPQRGELPREGFQRVDDPRMGPLHRMAVRADVLEDLKGTYNTDNEILQRYDQLLSYWKYGKVILNPATHVRNFLSNAVLANWGDVPFHDITTYKQALDAMRQKDQNQFYQEAKDWGLYRNTFVQSELAGMRDQLSELRSGEDLKKTIRKFFDITSNAYQNSEQLFKTAVYIRARKDGLSVDQAARKAEQSLFNYQDIPPMVRHLKRWWNPFFTWTYKAIPRSAEMAIRRPWKLGMQAAGLWGAEQGAKMLLSEEDEILEQMQDVMFGIDPGLILMPFKDQHGRNMFLDIAYILPYGSIMETWNQLPEFTRPITPIMPQHPLWDFAMAVGTNKDPFTGKQLYKEHADDVGQIFGKYLDYLWKAAIPNLLPGGSSFEDLSKAVRNLVRNPENQIKDWQGDPEGLTMAALDALMGIRLTPMDKKQLTKSLAYERKKVNREIQEKEQELFRQYKRNEISKKKYDEKIREMERQRKELLGSLKLDE